MNKQQPVKITKIKNLDELKKGIIVDLIGVNSRSIALYDGYTSLRGGDLQHIFLIPRKDAVIRMELRQDEIKAQENNIYWYTGVISFFRKGDIEYENEKNKLNRVHLYA